MGKKPGSKEVLSERMIFVTVGASNLGFDRLVKKMDEIAGRLHEEVIIQVGLTKYKPKHAKWYTYIDNRTMLELYNDANIIITHDGAGTLLTTLTLNKSTIVVPRLKKYNECAYTNKFDLAEALKEMDRIILVYDIEKLEKSIEEAKSMKCRKFTQNKKLISFLKVYINELEEGIKSGNG
jgi:beta-1,4-N-acetylglucosaminyltransferase